jgi:hypothetical protein
VFEDSTSTDKPVQCNRDIDPWTFLSAQLSGEAQQALLGK